ncbi:UbiX family flavin prenyltransferase [Simiduia agarivorans]|uniref:Flavin prenyltransferase UbiX n=1 Tax=Simiduia agarivorans (strain DSM 21679 / JCM 13881 / BCRC 17597 / SA1) TaxID=1117647 RepID=K4KII0_SIMAS|nr:UbiX family flavin prenyltransferase [Simiduia agarivorans]AFU98831.1 3-octaprenyl-4-hydroxybenzoate carboxy-lyase [Simiduia agarivorans SA1 = DSM 21679]
MSTPLPLIVGITGASGVIYGVRALSLLAKLAVPTHLVMSKAAELTLAYETAFSPDQVKALATEVHSPKHIGASVASGSFKTRGMLIAPCSIKSMSEIATGNTGGLVSRAADVVLKERRRLVLLVRETPLHTGHLRTMTQLSEMGAIIAPPVPAFYARPESLEEMVDFTLARALDLFDIEVPDLKRWDGSPP